MPRGFKALVTPLLKLLHPPSGVSIRKSQSSPANSAKCNAFSSVSVIYHIHCVCTRWPNNFTLTLLKVVHAAMLLGRMKFLRGFQPPSCPDVAISACVFRWRLELLQLLQFLWRVCSTWDESARWTV